MHLSSKSMRQLQKRLDCNTMVHILLQFRHRTKYSSIANRNRHPQLLHKTTYAANKPPILTLGTSDEEVKRRTGFVSESAMRPANLPPFFVRLFSKNSGEPDCLLYNYHAKYVTFNGLSRRTMANLSQRTSTIITLQDKTNPSECVVGRYPVLRTFICNSLANWP